MTLMPMRSGRWFASRSGRWVAVLLLAGAAHAAPYVPTNDAEVLEQVPARGSSPMQREIDSLRRSLARDPANAGTAVALVDRYLRALAAEGDPRYAGYAQAALAPWWKASQLPVDVRVRRAVLLQFDHRFAPAVADLQAVVAEAPAQVQAWAWLAAIAMVQARWDDARQACQKLTELGTPLSGQACLAGVEGSTGRGNVAAQRIERALLDAKSDASADADEQLWALTRLAEIEERLGHLEAAEKAFRTALALPLTDQYLQAAYADFLLDRGRAAEVLERLKDKGRSDVLLLRLALAAQAKGDASLATHRRTLAARFDAARQRGDTAHQKEEARFALEVLKEVPRALQLARANFELQREPADARVLLEAALAARDRAAAAPALAWYRESKIESQVLARLVQQVEAMP